MTGKEKARKILDNMKKDQNFMKPGRRNDDTVNLLICCYILDEDPDDFVEDHSYTTSCDLSMYEDHRDRIEDYLDTWCPEGSKEDGLDYCIETAYTKEVL